MANKDTTTSPMGMCEKLFNAINPAFRPIRRLTFRHYPETNDHTTPPPGSGMAMPAPEKRKKPGEEPKPQKVTPTSAPEEKVIRASTPKPSHEKTKTSTTITKVHDKIVRAQEPSAPAAGALPPPGKKNINDRVEEYITRAKAKIRTATFRS